jgi:hypothetical protein
MLYNTSTHGIFVMSDATAIFFNSDHYNLAQLSLYFGDLGDLIGTSVNKRDIGSNILIALQNKA